MLRAKKVHGEKKLAEMIVLGFYPYMPETIDDVPFIKEEKISESNTEWFCYQHQFVVTTVVNGEFIECYPRHYFGANDPESISVEKAFCVINKIFDYFPTKIPSHKGIY